MALNDDALLRVSIELAKICVPSGDELILTTSLGQSPSCIPGNVFRAKLLVYSRLLQSADYAAVIVCQRTNP